MTLMSTPTARTQVVLQWNLQRGVTVIPPSSKCEKDAKSAK
jgi:diketogulonate reductase-like aldo/keto reductase